MPLNKCFASWPGRHQSEFDMTIHMKISVVCAAIFVLLAGCIEQNESTLEYTKSDRAVARSIGRQASGVRFDPSAAAVGDSVAQLRIELMDISPSLVDSAEWTGIIQFSGTLTLSGSYRPHPDFPELEELCFYPDSRSAQKLPVFPNDARYAWLCFTNQTEAWDRLGRPPAEGEATVTVDEYRYYYAHSEVYNTARLADVEVATDFLSGIDWILLNLGGDSILPDSRITMNLTDTSVYGYSGCNWYGGRLVARGDSLSIMEAGQTARLCHQPAGVMSQEERFARRLASVSTYRIVNAHLQLIDQNGEAVLEFMPRTPHPMNPEGLIGTRWLLASPVGDSRDPSGRISLAFEREQIRGFAGCRNYTGSYSAHGDGIRFPSLAMKELECADDDLLELEGGFTTALSETTHYRLGDDHLELYTVGGDTLTFVSDVPDRLRSSK